ncbi:MAG: Flp pilus assembly protein CpaB [Pseudomonadota bacterium]|nr:Flp pilus assembly protein CpaB [Pseudomonadota bacterium]
MSKKIILVIAIVAGVAAAFSVQQHIAKLTGETITVYKTTTSADVGRVLGGSIEPVTLPANLFPDALSEAPTQEFYNYISRTPLRLPVSAGDLLLFRHFDASVDPGVLPAIPAGKKAISIPVNAASSVSYFIRPDDLVDVMATYAEQSASQNGGEPIVAPQTTRPVLEGVSVLAVGAEYRRSEIQKNEAYGTVTLLVSMEEAATLIYMRDFYKATLTLILRSKEDEEKEKAE